MIKRELQLYKDTINDIINAKHLYYCPKWLQEILFNHETKLNNYHKEKSQ